MALLSPRCVFIHIPKTGGQWVAAALQNAGLLVGRLGVVHTSPDEVVHEAGFKERSMVFTIVRHPLAWYQSFWAHMMDDKWEPIDDPDWFTPRWIESWAQFTTSCRADRFDEFIRKCVAQYPRGFVSMLYRSYTRSCTFVGKQERLEEDLVKVLKMAGEDFEVERIGNTPARNVRARDRRWRSRCEYSPELVRLVMSVEAEAIHEFGYTEVLEGASISDLPEFPKPDVFRK